MRRWIALLLAALMLTGSAAAEETLVPLTTPTPPETVRAVVEALFLAAAGTSVEAERLAREQLTAEELLLRNAERAEYRAKTLVWLKEAVCPADEAAEEEAASPVPTASPTPSPSPAPSGGITPEPTEIVWTLEDGYAALSGNEWGAAYLDALALLGAEDMEDCMALTKEICAQWMAEVDHERLKAINEDYACWIYAPGTQIDYPIVHGENNSYYLRRMFNGEKNSAGTLFIDYRNLSGFQDPNTLIYGHHMRNDSMFGTLTDYVDQAYYEAHPYMLLMSKEEICLLQLFAGYTTSDRDHCYDIAISDEEDMRLFLDEAMRKTNFVSGVQVKPFDRLVTLSTCAYAFEDARYIALGRLETIWRRELTAGDAAGKE